MEGRRSSLNDRNASCVPGLPEWWLQRFGPRTAPHPGPPAMRGRPRAGAGLTPRTRAAPVRRAQGGARAAAPGDSGLAGPGARWGPRLPDAPGDSLP